LNELLPWCHAENAHHLSTKIVGHFSAATKSPDATALGDLFSCKFENAMQHYKQHKQDTYPNLERILFHIFAL
jgi:hypothetical protein